MMRNRAVIFSILTISTLVTFLWIGDQAMSMNPRKRYITAPEPKNPGKYVPWECSFLTDHAPPLPPEAHKLFKEARALQKSVDGLTAGEEERVVALYKQAADQGHWKAMNNLSVCYLEGRGTEKNYAEANRLFDALIDLKVGYGYYGKYIAFNKGLGGEYDEAKADTYHHLAADLGVPEAQFELGMRYLYPEDRKKQGLQYLVCAVRQGHGEAAYKIGTYLETNKNYLMAAEYLYRGTSLGHAFAPMMLRGAFHPNNEPQNYAHTLGFSANEILSNAFYKYYRLLDENPNTRIPDVFKKHPLPENTLMTREQSRAMPSKLKDAFDGKWPDEIFPELAPDYLPPEPE